MEIHPYTPDRAGEVTDLFHRAVHALDPALYSPEQQEAWAPTPPDYVRWRERLALTRSFLAVVGGKVVGFMALDPEGHIDLAYTDPDWQGRGVAAALYRAVEAAARSRRLGRLTVEASLVARLFFERRGFLLRSENRVERNGQALTNFTMEKILEGEREPVGEPEGMNRNAYNRIAGLWDRARTGFYGREGDYLDAFLGGLPVPSSILDLGCGTGRPLAEAILGRGHRLTGVDQAGRLLDLARQRLPQGRWIESRIEDFRTSERFAGIVCWDTLFHIERRRHPELLERMAGLLLPGGRLMLTVGGSEHPAFTDTMFATEFFYDSLPPDRILSLLDRLGFRPLVSEYMNIPTSGWDKGRYAVVATRSPSNS